MHPFIENIRARATHGSVRKILLPEAEDERIQEAANILKSERIAEPVFVSVDETRTGALEELLMEVRASKAGTKDELTRERARELAHDPVVYGMYLLGLGEADGLVAGAARTTADVIRATLWLIGKAEGIQTVSSSFYMLVPDFRRSGAEEVLTFSDCAVVPQPSPEQLADIAIASADARAKIVGDEPRVAFLSYSTHGSGSGESVAVVRKAVELARARRPELALDGEFQVDAALMPAVAKRKAPESALGGRANTLIFPSLDAGNIAYKLVTCLTPGAQAFGPILQGFKKPVSDLSRGATVDDIVNTVSIVASEA